MNCDLPELMLHMKMQYVRTCFTHEIMMNTKICNVQTYVTHVTRVLSVNEKLHSAIT